MRILLEFHTMAAIFFYILLLVFNTKKKRLLLLTTKIFQSMIVLTNINLILDVLIFYATTYPEIIPYEFGVAFFKLYFISCMMVFSAHFIYVKKMCVRSASLTLCEVFTIVVPNILVMFIMIFTELEWYPKERHIRVDCMGLYVIFAMTIIYSIGVLTFYIRYWKHFSKKIKTAEILTAIVWGVGFLSQMFSSVFVDMIGTSLVLLMYIYFFYFENTSEIVDEKTGFFNKRGFKLMFEEFFSRKEEFQIINIGLDGLDYVRKQFGNEYAEIVLKNMEIKITEMLQQPVFLFKENNLLLLIVHDKDELEKMKSGPTKLFSQTWNVNGVNVKIEAKIRILRSSLIRNKKEIFNILNFITGPKFEMPENCNVVMIDETILEKEERQQKILTMVQYAIENDGFAVYYQPIYDAKSKMFSSAEALVRLKDTETLGFVSPEEFISIAEENGIVNKIGNIVFNSVCKTMKEEKLLDSGIRYMEINLSAKEAIDETVAARLSQEIRNYQLPANSFNLEVTETASVTSKHMLEENMKKLKTEGFTFSMDDFGTGYSNLAQIASLGYDIIKLDKSLIWPCFEEKGEKSMVILKNMINMIHELGMHIVAEGIETKDQADILTEFGVVLHQGYYYSRPIPKDEFIAFIREKNQ